MESGYNNPFSFIIEIPFLMLFLQKEQSFLLNFVGLFILLSSNIPQGFQSELRRWLLSWRLLRHKWQKYRSGKRKVGRKKRKSHSKQKKQSRSGWTS